MTVNDLFDECRRIKAAGFGNKTVLSSKDDECNGFHHLFDGFIIDQEEIDGWADSVSFPHATDPEDVVLLL